MEIHYVAGGQNLTLRLNRDSNKPKLISFEGKIYRKQRLLDQHDSLQTAGTLIENEDYGLFQAAIEIFENNTHKHVEGSYAATYILNNCLYAVRGVYDSPALYWVNVQKDLICISPEIDSVLKFLPQPVSLSADAVRHFLAFSYNLADSSPFCDLNSVAAGQGIRVDSDGQVRALDDHVPLQDSKLTECGAENPDWENAIKDALIEVGHGQRSIGLFLSGGIDSGSLAVFASELDLPVQAINLSIPTFPEEDEWRYADQLAKKLALPCHRVVVENHCFDNLTEMSMSLHGIGFNPYQGMINSGYKFAADLGISSIWTGTGGDELHRPKRYLLKDMYLNQNWFEIFRLLGSSSAYATPHLFKTLFNTLIHRTPKPMRYPDFIVDSTNGGDRFYQAPKAAGSAICPNYHRNKVFQFNHLNATALEAPFINAFNLNRVHPFIHPGVIELGLNTKATTARSLKVDKLSLRNALSLLIEDDFVWRGRVGVLIRYYKEGWNKNLSDIKEILFEDSESWSQFVDKNLLLNEFNYHNGNGSMLALNCLTLELWLNALRDKSISFTFR